MAPNSSSSTASPPGPALQSINAALHREPLASLFHAYFWCLFLVCWTPVAILALQVRAAIRLIFWLLAAAGGGHRGRAAWCDPDRSKQQYEMAVVITGCDCGFGKELALWAADAGYVVFAGCREKNSSWDGLLPDRLIPLQMDVTSDEQVAGAVKAVEAWLKGSGTQYEKKKRRVLHALINNAGVGTGGLVDWARLSDFQFCIDVNYLGMVRCCKAFLPIMKSQAAKRSYKDMRIFNMTSMAGLVPLSIGLSAYGASKHAANAFSSVLRMELKSFGIQVTTINPSFHATPLVHTMGDKAKQDWDKLDDTMKEEYGEAFYERFRYFCVDLPRRATWNADVVLEEVLKCLKSKHTPPDLLIGTDARFALPILRIVPAWCADFILGLNPLPIPAVMKNSY